MKQMIFRQSLLILIIFPIIPSELRNFSQGMESPLLKYSEVTLNSRWLVTARSRNTLHWSGEEVRFPRHNIRRCDSARNDQAYGKGVGAGAFSVEGSTGAVERAGGIDSDWDARTLEQERVHRERISPEEMPGEVIRQRGATARSRPDAERSKLRDERPADGKECESDWEIFDELWEH